MIHPFTDPRPPAPAPEAPPDPRLELLARLTAAARKAPLDELAAVVWIAERLSTAAGLSLGRYRDHKGRGCDVRDLEGGAVVKAHNALIAVRSLLGSLPPHKGMAVREVP